MANNDKVTNFEDPFQIADLAKREGPEGLLRLADYFETTGQPTPAPVIAALAMSRGPGVFPVKTPPRAKKRESSIYETTELGPIQNWSDDLVVMAAGQGRPEAIAERERRTRPALALRPVAPLRMSEDVPSSLRRSDWVTARAPTSQSTTAPVSSMPSLPLRAPSGDDLGVVPVPPPEDQAAELLGPFFKPVDEAGLPPEGIRLPIEPSPTMTPSVREPASTARAPAVSTQAATSVSTPVPVARVSPVSDQAGVKTGAIPATTPSTPAPPADTAAKAGLPAPQTEGAGGDVSERDLYLARLAAQSAAGFGAMGAGKSIDMGIADTLGERLKQVQALRAKREERSMELAREDEQSAALVRQYKSLAAQGLVAEIPDIDRLPVRQAASLIKTYGSLPGMAAKAAETKAMTPVKVEAGLAGAEGKRAQAKSRTYTDALNQARTENEIARKGVIAAQAEALRAKAELDKAKAAGAGDTDSRTVNARQKLVDAYQKQYLAPAESLAAVEAKAPGLTRGQPPEWLTGQELQLVRNNVTYELASDDTKDVFAAAQKYLDGYRKQQYGSALTATEQAELERLVKADIFTGADKLSRFFDLIRKDIANNFQNKLKGDRLVQQSFVDKYVGAEEGPLAKFVGPEGLFSDVWTLAKTSAAAPATAMRKPSAAAIAKLKADASPSAREAYDAYFGAGSSARDLGEGK